MTSLLTVLAAKNNGLVEQIGLDSLDEIPWEVFPLALGLSALIGAAAGLIYSGLLGAERGNREKRP